MALRSPSGVTMCGRRPSAGTACARWRMEASSLLLRQLARDPPLHGGAVVPRFPSDGKPKTTDFLERERELKDGCPGPVESHTEGDEVGHDMDLALVTRSGADLVLGAHVHWQRHGSEGSTTDLEKGRGGHGSDTLGGADLGVSDGSRAR
ncbi:hypothetical protein GUJ93_ZPchr0012g21526 [Zizania palustris]|uniref:Uncharacterized protein n=1 Tax=Zizania palustris TaxID=103762 RepID=A0A8J6BWI4_ZIZPA|nr:hypothetical protein GUJ93_ZPchr0012g21526 [Zizania palustris]